MAYFSISVFFPCYNEQDNVERVVRRAAEVLEKTGADFEIIIVNDGSKDRTGERADAIAKTDKRIRVVHHPRNMGYGAAVQSGIRAATKELVFFTDGDGQFDIEEIKVLLAMMAPQRFLATEHTEDTEKFLATEHTEDTERFLATEHTPLPTIPDYGIRGQVCRGRRGQDARDTYREDTEKKYDIVCGYRLNRQDPFVRKLNGWLWTKLVCFLFGMKIRDIDCAFKLFKKEVFDHIKMSSAGALISAEILARASRAGYKITEAGVHHYPRTAGKQTGAKLKVILRAFKELFKLYKRIRKGQ